MYEVKISGGSGFCNAVRRALLSNVKTWAPNTVTIYKNTSCFTDEFIAHRIGMIPFKKIGNGTSAKVKARGPNIVVAKSITGDFEAVHDTIEVVNLADAVHEIDISITFNKCTASTHARYATCTGVGMEPIQKDRHRITFGVAHGQNATDVFHEALDSINDAVDDALLKLSNQEIPPVSCG